MPSGFLASNTSGVRGTAPPLTVSGAAPWPEFRQGQNRPDSLAVTDRDNLFIEELEQRRGGGIRFPDGRQDGAADHGLAVGIGRALPALLRVVPGLRQVERPLHLDFRVPVERDQLPAVRDARGDFGRVDAGQFLEPGEEFFILGRGKDRLDELPFFRRETGLDALKQRRLVWHDVANGGDDSGADNDLAAGIILALAGLSPGLLKLFPPPLFCRLFFPCRGAVQQGLNGGRDPLPLG